PLWYCCPIPATGISPPPCLRNNFAKGATVPHGNCLTVLFPPLDSPSTKFDSKPRTRRRLLAHNFESNFPVCVTAVGACPSAVTFLFAILLVLGYAGTILNTGRGTNPCPILWKSPICPPRNWTSTP